MYNFNSKWVIFFLLILANLTYSQSNVKTWTESTIQDFSDNQLNNIIITNDSCIKVQLPYPLVKTIADYNNNSFNRFITKDDPGNFVKTTVTEDGIVYVQKYSADGKEITKRIRANDVLCGASNNTSYWSTALLNNGTYIVMWSNTANEATTLSDDIYGQIFVNDSVKQGTNFKINDVQLGSYFLINVIADNKDQNFILFYSLRTADEYKLYVQKRDPFGNKIGEAKLLNPENLTANEYGPKAVADEKGYWVSWFGVNKLYLRHFTFDGVPLSDAVIANDTIALGLNSGLSICRDKDSHLLTVWEGIDPIHGGSNIYGQLYDSLCAKIGVSIKLNTILTYGNNQVPDIELEKDEFRVSWWCDNKIYVCGWKYDPKLSGEMISSIFDGSPSGCSFSEISWILNAYPRSNLKFQIRSGRTLGELNNSAWYGPSSPSDYYTLNTGEKINTIHNGDRFIQYKAFFTSEIGNSPQLNSVSIKYIPNDAIFPKPPLYLTATNNHVHVFLNWQPNSDKDVSVYKIYRGVASKKYDESWYRIVPKNVTSFTDSSALVGKKYYYAVTAIDSSHNESGYSNEAPMMFSGIKIYVSNHGSTSGSGSINDPVETIQHGLDLASPGDTLMIMPGEYAESFEAKPRVSFIGAGADKCRIYFIKAYDDCIIKGLTIQSVYCFKGSPIITENIIRGGDDKAIILNDYPCSPIITKNFITNCSIGIFTNGSSGDPIIKNNIIIAKDVGIDIIYLGSPTIINNVISVPPAPSVWMSLSEDKSIVENNILLGGIGLSTVSPYIGYNDIWNAQFPISGSVGTNIGVNPGFVNEDIQDYRLLSTSRCKDAGDPKSSYNDVDGTRNDIGVYGGPDPFDMVLTSQLSRSISVSSLSGFPGDTISVFISLDNNAGLGKVDLTLEYDNTLLGFLNAELTDATSSFNLDHGNLSLKDIKLSLTAGSGLIGMSKNILRVKFVVNPGSKTNDASPLILKNVNLSDTGSKEILLTSLTNGAFVVNNTTVSANYIYVDAQNPGTEKGDKKHPFKTIMGAINSAVQGDTILVAGGNYHESVTMKEGVFLFGSGSSVTNIITSANQYAVLFDNVKNSEVSGFSFLSEGLHDVISPLITCRSSSPKIRKNVFTAEVYQKVAIECSNNSNADIENNCLKQMDLHVDASSPVLKNNSINCFFEGVKCTGKSNPVISGNKITGAPGMPAININQSSALINNNYIYGDIYAYGYGILLTNADNSKVFNNIIKGQTNSYTGTSIVNSQNVAVVNNIFVSKGSGIEETGSTANIINNIVVNSSGYGIEFSESSTMDYNAFWNNSTNYNGTNPGSHNIQGDILFADTSKDNYRLLKGSPCINAGNPDFKYNDIDGTRNDIGAYGGTYADSSWINQDGSTLAVNQVTEKDTIQVQIKGEKVKGIAEINMELSYDPSILTVIDANSSDLTKSFSIQRSSSKAGTVNLDLKSSKVITEDKGVLIELKYAVNSPGTTTTLHFESATAWDEAAIVKNISNLKDGQIKIITGIGNVNNGLPKVFSLSQNYPNPFNPSTKIRYEIPIESKVKIKIYDLLGRELTTLINGTCKAGMYEIEWNAFRYSSGVYFYRMQAGDFVQTRKMLLLK